MFWMLNVFIQWWSKPFYNANAVINQPPPLYLLQRSFLQISISARLFVHNYSDLHLYNKSFFALKFLPSFQFFFKTLEKCLKYFYLYNFIYIILYLKNINNFCTVFIAPIAAFRNSCLNDIFVHGAYFSLDFFPFYRQIRPEVSVL